MPAKTGTAWSFDQADDQSLGADLLARLSRGRVLPAAELGAGPRPVPGPGHRPATGTLRWIADLLVERAPAAGYAPAPGGFLSADEAWRQVLECALGIADARPDALALLEWTLGEDASARLLALGEPMRSDVCDWLGAAAAGRPPHRCLHRGGQGGGLRAARPGLRAGLPGRQPDRPRVVGRRGAARTLHRRPADRAVRRGPMGDGRRGRAGSAVRSRPLARTARPRRPPARGAQLGCPCGGQRRAAGRLRCATAPLRGGHRGRRRDTGRRRADPVRDGGGTGIDTPPGGAPCRSLRTGADVASIRAGCPGASRRRGTLRPRPSTMRARGPSRTGRG